MPLAFRSFVVPVQESGHTYATLAFVLSWTDHAIDFSIRMYQLAHFTELYYRGELYQQGRATPNSTAKWTFPFQVWRLGYVLPCPPKASYASLHTPLSMTIAIVSPI